MSYATSLCYTIRLIANNSLCFPWRSYKISKVIFFDDSGYKMIELDSHIFDSKKARLFEIYRRYNR
jgi:hypothetical protein